MSLTQPETIQAFTAEETAGLEEPLPLPARDMDIPYDLPESWEQRIEPQLAFMGKVASEVGRVAGRVFGGGREELGQGWKKLQQLEMDKNLEDLRKKGASDPLEAAVKALDPKVGWRERHGMEPITLDEAVPTGPPKGDLLNVRVLSRTSHPSDVGNTLLGGAPHRIVDDAERFNDYSSAITTGDDVLDKILAERLANDPDMQGGIIAGIRAVGAKGDEKIPNEGHVRALLNSIGAQVERHLAGKNPAQLKTMSLEAMSDLADLLGEDPNRLKLNFMGGLQVDLKKPGHLGAQMIAGKNLLISELKVLDKISDEVINAPMGVGRDAARIAWRRQAEMVAQLQLAFKGTQTEMARAIGALRQPNITDAQLLSRDLTTIVDELDGGVQKLDEAIMAYRAAEDPVARLRLAKALTRKGTWFDAMFEVWLNSILMGYFSHVKNIAGGFAMMLSDNLETIGAATGQLYTRSVWGLERDVTFGDVGAKMFGQFMSMREAFTAAGKAAWYREDPSFLGRGSKLDRPVFHKQHDAFSAAGLQLEGNWGKAVDYLGSAATMGRVSMRALQAEDAFFKVSAFRGALYEEAWRTGRQQGLKGDEFSTHIARFMFEPPEAAIIKAQDQAKYVTLQTETEGTFKDLQKFFRGRARWIVPFYKTPLNSILYVGERSPVAPFMGRYKRAIEAGGADAAKAKSRFAMGMATFAILAAEYEQDNITGGISDDAGLRAAYNRENIKPYSRRIGDTYYNYNLMEPVSTIIGLVSDTMEIIHHPNTDDRTVAELVIGIAGAIGYNMTNKTFLVGVAKFIEAIRSNNLKRMEAFVQGYATSAIPGSAALNDIRRLNDNLVRFRTDVLDGIRAKLPGLSEHLGAARDLWGRPQAENRFSSPYKPNARDSEIRRIGLSIDDHPKNAFGADIELNIEERDFFHEVAGIFSARFIDAYMKSDAFKLARRVSASTGDSEARDDIKAGFSKEITVARKKAKQAMASKPDDLEKFLTQNLDPDRKGLSAADAKMIKRLVGQQAKFHSGLVGRLFERDRKKYDQKEKYRKQIEMETRQ